MTLGEKQRLFAGLVSDLIRHAYEQDYALTFGAAFRDPAWGVGHKKSLHGMRLAVDLNLFVQVDGVWVFKTATEDHRPLGEWWEARHALARWGGRFQDGNHYSLEHEGMR